VGLMTMTATQRPRAGKAFTGWSDAAPAFFAELESHNTKQWWIENKARYDTDVLAPMQLLAADVAAEFGTMSIKRPHRDIRFSTDKSPYKTTIAGGIDASGGMLLGVQLSASELSVVAGHFELAPDQLTRFRQAIMADPSGEDFVRRIEKLGRQGYELQSFSSLKGVAKGYPKDHPRARFLGLKGLHVGRSWPAGSMPVGSTATKAIVTPWRDAAPLIEWLTEHVGPSEVAPNRSTPNRSTPNRTTLNPGARQ
jgi:uncharacterized protein (TIGR02453 family)